MKKLLTTLAAAAILSSGAYAQTFTLKSSDMGGQIDNKQFMNGMGYTGQNLSPQLSWENAPQGTTYFAITVYDMDAPTGSGFWHWIVFNIPANVHELKAGAGDPLKSLLPAGAIQSNTDMGVPGFVGAAPPAGAAHRYVFTVYALGKKIDLDKTTTPPMVGYTLNSLALAKASLLVYGQHP